MKGIFLTINDCKNLSTTWADIDKDLSTLAITDVFIHSGARDERLRQAVNTFHLHGRKVHLCTDCFSGGNHTYKRWEEILDETKYAFNNYKIDFICLDAIRYWQPSDLKGWIKFILSNWNERCKGIEMFLDWFNFMIKKACPGIQVSACLKCELPSYKWAKWFAKLYGQDYSLMAPHVDFFLIMSYKYLYGFWKDYHPVNLATELQADTKRETIPMIQAYYNPKEYNSLGRMPTWKEIREDMFLDNWVLYLYGDMKRGGLF